MNVQQHRIFVSHSHLDNDFGTRLIQDLQGVLGDESAVWYDASGGLHGGDAWWRKIVRELESRNIFIVILSPDAMNSDWVNDEIDIAWRQKNSPVRMRIFPLLYRPCEVRTDLTNLQIISFLPPKPYETAFQEVLIALGLPTEVKAKPEKVTSSVDEPGTALARQIERAFAEQDWPDVIRKVNYLLKRFPEAASSGVYRMQGLALLEEGQVQQAQEALESALALVEDRQQRLTVLSDYTGLLAKEGRWDEVLQRAREALRLVPNDPGWLAMKEQAGRKILGESAALPKTERQTKGRKQAISSPPQKTQEQWIEEGNMLFNNKQYEEAQVAYNHAIELDPNYAIAFSRTGAALINLGRYQEALTALDEALRLDPTDVNTHRWKASVLISLGRNQEALIVSDEALRLDSNDAYSYCHKGNALLKLGRYQEALTILDEAIRLEPNNAYPYRDKGAALINLGRYQEALTILDEAIRLDPSSGLAYHNKGVTLEKLGRSKEARQAYDKARELGYKG